MEVRSCSVDGCPSKASARGWCTSHYNRWYRYGEPTADRTRRPKPCTVAQCTIRAKGHGLCAKHLKRVRAHGDPDVSKPGGRPTVGDEPGWSAAHKRVSRKRGKASAYSCVDCGRSAGEWSYNNRDANELVDPKLRLAYSLLPEHYDARCVPCHRAFDAKNRRSIAHRPEQVHQLTKERLT